MFLPAATAAPPPKFVATGLRLTMRDNSKKEA